MVDLQAISHLIGVPYIKYGVNPDGWNCMGCLAYVRRVFFNRPTPDWTDVYDTMEYQSPDVIAAHIRERLPRWRQVDPAPGAALLFKILGARCHVGVYLGSDVFIHAMEGYDTATASLDNWIRRGRLEGAYEYD